MEHFIKNGEVKPLNRIVVFKDDKQCINPTEEMVIEDGWIKLTINEPTAEELLQQAKNNKIKELKQYDSSYKVNECTINYQNQILHYWSDREERSVLKGVIKDFINVGKTEYRLDLRDLGISIWLPCEILLHMLEQLEIYAAECYNKTSDHIYNINALTSVEDINSYDFTVGYPDKLIFKC